MPASGYLHAREADRETIHSPDLPAISELKEGTFVGPFFFVYYLGLPRILRDNALYGFSFTY
jgi:hypothetical protein